MSLSENGFERTRKREFLDEMTQVVPWAALVALIAPHAPARGTKAWRPPFLVQTMLLTHFLQWFPLRADSGTHPSFEMVRKSSSTKAVFATQHTDHGVRRGSPTRAGLCSGR